MKAIRVEVRVIADRYDSKLLLGRMKGSASDEWSFPGGVLEDESPIECAKRIMLEQVKQELHVPVCGFFTYDDSDASVRVLTLYVAGVIRDTPRLEEWEGCTEWGWYKWDKLPEPLADHIERLEHMLRHIEDVDTERRKAR